MIVKLAHQRDLWAELVKETHQDRDREQILNRQRFEALPAC